MAVLPSLPTPPDRSVRRTTAPYAVLGAGLGVVLPGARLVACLLGAAVLVGGVGCGGGPPSGAASPASSKPVSVPNQILGPRAEGTSKELRDEGERALLAREWQRAVDAFEVLIAGDAAAASDPSLRYDLGIAYEGLGEREKARAEYRKVAALASGALARNALAREVSLDAYLEDWPALGAVGETLLARSDLEPTERMLGLGARGLSKIEAGDEGASHDILAGLDLVDEYRYGATGQLPVAAAMLKYAYGELKKLRSEKIVLDPPGDDFVLKLEMRCQALLEAQSAYADAIRAVDPLWASMSGYRVGEMYRTLHQALMRIPPTDKAKTESDKQLFYAIMHVRYRALLDKGIEMMNRTLAFGEKTGVASAWTERARDAKAEMEQALEREKTQIATYPFTEAEVEKALEIMKKKAAEKASAPPAK